VLASDSFLRYERSPDIWNNLKGKECDKGIYQRKDGLFSARYYAKYGKRKEKYFETLPDWKKRTLTVNAIRQFQQATPPVSKKGRKKGVQEI